MGGHLFGCPTCQKERFRYHACQNRPCPRCRHEAAQTWLAQPQLRRLPVPYFLLTFTLPAPLRAVVRAIGRLMVPLLFQASAQATQTLAQDPRHIGGQIGRPKSYTPGPATYGTIPLSLIWSPAAAYPRTGSSGCPVTLACYCRSRP